MNAKLVFQTMLFVIFLIILTILTDLLLFLFLNEVVLNLLNWFNRLNTFLKIIIGFFGGATLLYVILGVFQAAVVFITQPVFNKLPFTSFSASVAFLLFAANSIYVIYKLFQIVANYNFWTVIELIILSICIISINWSVLVGRKKTTTLLNQPS